MRLIAPTRDCCCLGWRALPQRSGRHWSDSCRRMRLTKRRTRLMICGTLFMDLRDLVEAILGGDLLTARQWVADAQREPVNWESLEYPSGFSGRELTVAAGLVELLARRAGNKSPA